MTPERPKLLITEVLEKECGIPSQPRNYMIHCPMHDDKHASAKVYVETDSMYCWACGKAWGAQYLIKDLHHFTTYRELYDYCKETYNVEIYNSRSDNFEDLSLLSYINILKGYNFFDTPKYLKVLEAAICRYNKKDRDLMLKLSQKIVTEL